MESTDLPKEERRALAFSREFDGELRARAAWCEDVPELEEEICRFIREKFRKDPSLFRRYDVPENAGHPADFFETLMLCEDFEGEMPD